MMKKRVPLFAAFSNRFIALALVLVFLVSLMGTARASALLDRRVSNFLARETRNVPSTLRVIIEFKNLQSFDEADAQGHSGRVAALLRENARASQQEVRALLQSRNFRAPILDIWAANSIVVTMDRKTLDLLKNREDIERISAESTIKLPPAKKVETLGPRGKVEWSLSIVGADKVWNELGVTGKGVTLGIIDTGIFADHPDLKGKVTVFKDFSRNAAGESVAAYDDQGHGTHCAGTICGGAESGTSIGVAPDALLIVAKSFTASGSAEDGALMGAMQWMLDPDNNPDTDDAPPLVSNSWGSSDQTSTTYWKIVEAWRAAGIFPLFAAGNSGPRPKTAGTPGGYPHSFAIGATDSRDGIASFSSRGPIVWNGEELIKPNVSAPGDNIRSAGHRGGYTTKSGTSMATPNVAGVIALLLSADPGLGIEDIWRVLEETADDLGDQGRDNNFGTGRVNAFMAVRRVLLDGKVKGRILAADNSPIKGRILIPSAGFEAASDSAGNYTLSLAEGEYELFFRAFGYQEEVRRVKVIRKQSQTLDITMKSAPQGSLTVKIQDSDGSPIAGAALKVIATPLEALETGADGSVLIKAPLGTYQVMVSAFGFSTKIVDGLKVAQPPVQAVIVMDRLPSLLVVDESGKEDAAAALRSALEALGMKHSWITGGQSATALVINQYPVVLWFTGTSYSNILKEGQQKDLADYVKGGGNLFLAGADIGYTLKSNAFMSSTLCAKFINDNSKAPAVNGLGVLEGLSLNITGDTTGLKQSYPDVLEALQAGKVAGAYDNGLVAAVSAEQGQGRVLYLGFCVSGVKGVDRRKVLLEKALKWLYPDIERAVLALASYEKGSERASISGQTLVSRCLSLILGTNDGHARFKAVLEGLTKEQRDNVSALEGAVLEYEKAR